MIPAYNLERLSHESVAFEAIIPAGQMDARGCIYVWENIRHFALPHAACIIQEGTPGFEPGTC